tara:strand:+ start:309 stop:521 length:213 start_codon:yes stop_codon:yes gene_type:complete
MIFKKELYLRFYFWFSMRVPPSPGWLHYRKMSDSEKKELKHKFMRVANLPVVISGIIAIIFAFVWLFLPS